MNNIDPPSAPSTSSQHTALATDASKVDQSPKSTWASRVTDQVFGGLIWDDKKFPETWPGTPHGVTLYDTESGFLVICPYKDGVSHQEKNEIVPLEQLDRRYETEDDETLEFEAGGQTFTLDRIDIDKVPKREEVLPEGYLDAERAKRFEWVKFELTIDDKNGAS